MTTTHETAFGTVTLDLGGMTCATCANRIERSLNKLDGVEASVNFATERADVRFDPERASADTLVGAVEKAGYRATVHAAPAPPIREAAAANAATATDTDIEMRRPATTPDAVARTGPPTPTAVASRPDGELEQRLIGAIVLGAPVVVLSMVPAFQFRNWQWLAFALAGPVTFWAGWPFHRTALRTARHGGATMDTLVSIGVLAAFAWSTWALFWGMAGMAGMRMSMTWRPSRAAAGEHLYLEVAVTVVAFVLAGRWLEARAKRRARGALSALATLGAKDAALLAGDGTERRVPVADLAVGDRFVVRPGEQVATDGVVEEGASAVDRSLLTGESVPVDVAPGDAVAGATLNVGGRLVVRATKVGADTALARITRLVEEAQAGKAPIQRLADRVAAVFVPAVLLIAAGTLVAWLLTGHRTVDAFTAAVAVLVVACPCALGLATPTALLVGTGRGAQLGILLRGPEVLESTRRVDTVVLDKTGTVTTGSMALASFVVPEDDGVGGVDAAGDRGHMDHIDAGGALTVLAAVEAASEHPVAAAIVAGAHVRCLPTPLPAVTDFLAHAGLGVEGIVGGRSVIAGRATFLADAGVALPPPVEAAVTAAEHAGQTAVVMAVDGRAVAVAAVADAVKPTSAEAVALLRAMGLRPVLLTGDNPTTAHAVAAAVGIEPGDVVAGVLPDGKAAEIARLQQAGRVVAMVGDGVNDAPALAQADLGISMGGGTDAAIEASDLTLVAGDLRLAPRAIALSRRTLRTIKGNLFWAFVYNLAALPLAALGLLNPVIAGLTMAASSVFVVSNSLRLRRA